MVLEDMMRDLLTKTECATDVALLLDVIARQIESGDLMVHHGRLTTIRIVEAIDQAISMVED